MPYIWYSLLNVSGLKKQFASFLLLLHDFRSFLAMSGYRNQLMPALVFEWPINLNIKNQRKIR
ncbi:MAG: hypothetical protein CMQ41_16385 [Gammaproteobacteria bacterium]|nr:hypothetical protein [Gammaproteobacteria bacterium]